MGRALVIALALALASACVPEPERETVLRVALADDWAPAPAVEQVIEEFEADHPRVRVEVDGSPFSRMPELVGASPEGGRSYDLAHWHAFAAAAADLAQPVDDLWEEHGLRSGEYLEGALQSVTWGDRRYGVPLDTNAMVVMVRPRVLERAGLDAEDLASTDGLLDVAHRLVDQDAAEYALLASASSWEAYGWIRAFGGEVVRVDAATAEPTFTFDAPAVVEALELGATLIDEGLAPPPFAPDHATEGVQLFAADRLALHTTGSWDLPTLEQAGVDTAEILVLPLPRGDGDTATVLGGSSLFVPHEAEHRELGFELAVRLTEDPVAARLVEEEGRLPARTRMLDHEALRSAPGLATFVEQLHDADVMPLIAFPEVAEAFREGIENALSGRRSAQAAMEDVQGFAERWLEARE